MTAARHDLRPPPTSGLSVSAAPGDLGALIVDGFEPDQHASDPVLGDWLRTRLWHHGVLCLRMQSALTDAQHRAVTAMIGPIKDPVSIDGDGAPVRDAEEKQIIDSGFVLTDELRAELGDVALGGDQTRPGLFEAFHTDDSYVPCPASVTVLHARQLPTGPGGATSFIDMRAAYTALAPAERDQLVGLTATHAYNNRGAFPPRPAASGPLERMIEVSHPVVRAHPVVGAPALYFDLDRAVGIDQLPLAEGCVLLQSLQDRAEREAPRYAHAWHRHDVLLWDNASVQHKAGGDFAVGEPRRFWRFMVEGTAPLAGR